MSQMKAFGEGLPTDLDIRSADQLRNILAVAPTDEAGNVTLQIAGLEQGSAEIVLTHDLAQTFTQILRFVSSGKGFQVIPYQEELSTQQAADFLNVSRPYLIKLLERGDIKFTKVGRHRRIKAEDLFSYKSARDKDRADHLSELAELDSESL